MKRLMEEFQRWLESEKKAKELFHFLLSLIVILSVSLLVYHMAVSPGEEGELVTDQSRQLSPEISFYDSQESRFTRMLSQIKGVGEVSVMLTYRQEERQEQTVQGVMIVAEGAGDIVVKNQLTDAAKSVFGLPASRVSVQERK